MNQIKYIYAAAMIEKAIRRGLYRDRLPTVAEMARQIGVAIQTMSEAIATLVKRGILTTSPRGTRLAPGYETKLRSHTVGICGRIAQGGVAADPLVRELAALIEADGDDPLLLGMFPGLRHNAEFWRSGYVDGYIFTYSSFDPEFAGLLRTGGIPFVVANRVTDAPVHWVDWNHWEIFNRAIGALVAAQCRSIAVLVPRSGKKSSNWEMIYREIRSLKREYQLPILPFDDYVIHNRQHLMREWLELLLAQKKFPDALIVSGWNISVRLVAALRTHGLHPGRDYRLVAQAKAAAEQELFGYIQVDDYRLLASAVWRRFQVLRENPNLPPEGILIDAVKAFQLR